MDIDIIIVEDQPLFAELLTIGLDGRRLGSSTIHVLGSYRTASQALSASPSQSCDVALLDYHLGPGPTGLELGRTLRERRPKMGVVLLSQYRTPDLLKVLPPNEMSGWGYLIKQSATNIDTVIRTIVHVHNGLFVVDPSLAELLQPIPNSPIATLTVRQRHILTLMAEGYSNYAIAAQLSLAEKSVENQITQIYHHLGIVRDGQIHSRVAATRLFLHTSHVVDPTVRPSP